MLYAGKSKRTAETFKTLESELKSIHNNRYSYDNAVFINARTPFLITCKEHGDFLQQPRAHKNGQGCRKCFDEKMAISRKLEIGYVTSKLAEMLSSKNLKLIDNVSEHNYKNAHQKVKVKCLDCGTQKKVKICSVLNGYIGCGKCSRKAAGEKQKIPKEEFIQRVKAAGKGRFEYIRIVGDYLGSKRTNVEARCLSCGNVWQSTTIPNTGCPQCAKATFINSDCYKNRSTTVYYVKITDPLGKTMYKIGVTLINVESRFSSELNSGYTIETLATWTFTDGTDAILKEKEILSTYSEYLLNKGTRGINKFLVNGGNTEVFTKDVLNLDTKGVCNE
jgi:hypothetical protein